MSTASVDMAPGTRPGRINPSYAQKKDCHDPYLHFTLID
jgi:hypothetical protein